MDPEPKADPPGARVKREGDREGKRRDGSQRRGWGGSEKGQVEVAEDGMETLSRGLCWLLRTWDSVGRRGLVCVCVCVCVCV